MSNGLDPNQDLHSVCPDLEPNCLQRLSVEDKVAASKERVEIVFYLLLHQTRLGGKFQPRYLPVEFSGMANKALVANTGK